MIFSTVKGQGRFEHRDGLTEHPVNMMAEEGKMTHLCSEDDGRPPSKVQESRKA